MINRPGARDYTRYFDRLTIIGGLFIAELLDDPWVSFVAVLMVDTEGTETELARA